MVEELADILCLDGSERPGCAGPHRGEAAEPSAQIYEAVVAVGGGGALEASWGPFVWWRGSKI